MITCQLELYTNVGIIVYEQHKSLEYICPLWLNRRSLDLKDNFRANMYIAQQNAICAVQLQSKSKHLKERVRVLSIGKCKKGPKDKAEHLKSTKDTKVQKFGPLRLLVIFYCYFHSLANGRFFDQLWASMQAMPRPLMVRYFFWSSGFYVFDHLAEDIILAFYRKYQFNIPKKFDSESNYSEIKFDQLIPILNLKMMKKYLVSADSE